MPRIPHSNICYGGTPMHPKGDASHSHGVKEIFPWGLEIIPKPHGDGTFDSRSLGLRKEEVPQMK